MHLLGLAQEVWQHSSVSSPIHLFTKYLLSIFTCQTRCWALGYSNTRSRCGSWAADRPLRYGGSIMGGKVAHRPLMKRNLEVLSYRTGSTAAERSEALQKGRQSKSGVSLKQNSTVGEVWWSCWNYRASPTVCFCPASKRRMAELC